MLDPNQQLQVAQQLHQLGHQLEQQLVHQLGLEWLQEQQVLILLQPWEAIQEAWAEWAAWAAWEAWEAIQEAWAA